MAKRYLHKIGSSKRRQLRPLKFDTLEDRRLLAGLNISVFEDVDASDNFTEGVDQALSGRVLFIDQDYNGRFGPHEKFAVTDANGLAQFSDLLPGDYQINVLGKNQSAVSVNIVGETDLLSLEIASTTNADNLAPVNKKLPASLLGQEDTDLALNLDFLNSLVENPDQDKLYFFLAKDAAHGRLEWTYESGAKYSPDADYFGTDSIQVVAYDGQEWTSPIDIGLKIEGVDDLPTAFHVDFAVAVPENLVNAILGSYTIDDIDGGTPQFYYSDSLLIEASDGLIRLAGNRVLNYELSSQFAFTVALIGNASDPNALQKSALIPVTDTNDLSTGIQFQGVPQVVEFRRGHRFGTVRVIDEDSNDTYSWESSDDRFYVDDQNSLRLLPNTFLATRDQSVVPIQLTATSQKGGDAISTSINITVDEAPPSYQNQAFPLDVNNDGRVTVADALDVVNALNRKGMRDLSGPPPAGSYFYIDVNGDKRLTTLDLLVVINYLNQQSRQRTGEGQPRSPSSPATPSGGNLSGGEGESAPKSTPLVLPRSASTPSAAEIASQSALEYQQRLKKVL